MEHKERIHAQSHTLPEKKEGHPFKCGAAALIYWVKMGNKKRKEWQRSDRESFFIHPHGWRVTASSTLTKSAGWINPVINPKNTCSHCWDKSCLFPA